LSENDCDIVKIKFILKSYFKKPTSSIIYNTETIIISAYATLVEHFMVFTVTLQNASALIQCESLKHNFITMSSRSWP